jgi:hypothetical protein
MNIFSRIRYCKHKKPLPSDKLRACLVIENQRISIVLRHIHPGFTKRGQIHVNSAYMAH